MDNIAIGKASNFPATQCPEKMVDWVNFLPTQPFALKLRFGRVRDNAPENSIAVYHKDYYTQHLLEVHK